MTGFNVMNFIPLLISPQLSIVGYGYNLANSTNLKIKARSLDYNNNTVTELIFQD